MVNAPFAVRNQMTGCELDNKQNGGELSLDNPTKPNGISMLIRQKIVLLRQNTIRRTKAMVS